MAAQKPLRSMIASAVTGSFAEPLWNKYLSTDEAWQTEIWRLYDVVPEFSRGANYVGSCCSRCRLFVAEVDDTGEIVGEVEATDPVGQYARTVFGGPARRADMLRLMGVDLTVAGEFWILGINADKHDLEVDKWFCVSRNELRRIETVAMTGGETLMGESPEMYEFFDGRRNFQLTEGEDILYRTWTNHPYRTWCADSPGRSLQMVLVELEILTQYILAQARSRLASAGVWIWPSGTDFPTKDSDPVNATSLMERMLRAGEQNMKSFGSASQVLPMIVEMPEKVFDRIQAPIQFGSQLSKEAMELRKELRDRLAAGMDIAPEIITGMGEATGWNTFSIEASTVEAVVKPTMARICNAATEVYLWPQLRAQGKNPYKYKFWFDTAPLLLRPNRVKETIDMYNLGIVGEAEVRKAADLPEGAAMPEAEQEKVLARKMLLSDSNLILIPALRKIAGLTSVTEIVPDGQMPGQDAQPGIAGRAPAPPPPARTIKDPNGPALAPKESIRPGNPDGRTPEPVTASAAQGVELAMLVAADAAVRGALERAGKALLRLPGGGEFRNVPPEEVHLKVRPANGDHARALVASGWRHLDALMEALGRPDEASALRDRLTEYCVDLMCEGRPHEVRVLRGWLRELA